MDGVHDSRFTREAAEKLGIALHDHLVVSKDGYKSFKTMGLL